MSPLRHTPTRNMTLVCLNDSMEDTSFTNRSASLAEQRAIYTEVEHVYDQPSISPDRHLWHACKHYQPSIKIDLMFRTIWSRPGIVFGKNILNSKPIGPAFHLPRQTSTAAVLCRTIRYSLGNVRQWYKLSKTWCHSATAFVETQTPCADETSSYNNTQRSSTTIF